MLEDFEIRKSLGSRSRINRNKHNNGHKYVKPKPNIYVLVLTNAGLPKYVNRIARQKAAKLECKDINAI